MKEVHGKISGETRGDSVENVQNKFQEQSSGIPTHIFVEEM